MRPHVLAPALALALLLPLAPLAEADEERRSSVGVNLGYVAPGLWQLYRFASPGGVVDTSLTWVPPTLFPFADYDLRIYEPWAMDDGRLSDHELAAHSSQHPYQHHSERIVVPLGVATYWIAIVPFQTQNEPYTLTTNVGDLQYAGVAFGYVAYSP